MIAWWMAQLALLGTLLALAAYGAESALKTAGRSTRWAWMAALALTIVLGVMAPVQFIRDATPGRTWVATPTVSRVATTAPAADAFSVMRTAWHDITQFSAVQVQRAWSVWNDAMPATIGPWMLGTWIAVSVALCIAFVGVHWRFQRRRAQWPLGSLRGTTVRIAHDTGPAVIGVTNAEIVVPRWLLSRDDREQQLVLSHELEHVRMHDPVLLALAQMAVVLMPWHPAVWWMAARLRLAVELDCDRRVLQRGASARDYGTLLIDLTDHRTGFGAALPAFSCSPSHLERRLIAMTPTKLRYPLVRALSTGAFASLALLAACEAKLPTSQEMDEMTASTATATAGRLALVDTSKVAYFIDDAPATKAEAERLGAARIASVNVTQKGMQSGGEVRIVTRNGALKGDSTGTPHITFIRTDSAAPGRVSAVNGADSIVMIADTILLAGDKPSAEITMRRAVPGLPMMEGAVRFSPSTPSTASPSSTAPRTSMATFTGLMVVDGVITDPAVVNSLSPDQIVSVQITKGAAAARLYSDPRAANGVILITTKKAKP
jgi:beta-lactamase regulating signal transducer with metallopeptidase domain